MDNSLLYQNLNQYTHIGEQEFEIIENVLTSRRIKKKRTVLNHGEISRYLFFVVKGALRSYTVGQDGNEHIIQFAFEGHWVSDLSSFITQTPGEIVIEAIEESEVLLFPHHELEVLLDKIPALEKFFRHLYQKAYVALQKRVNMRDSTTAKERYKELISKQPDIAKRIPLLYIASYLGITAESLSRIRGAMANER
ncbi:Crp/Fnr family transcriptional regulator [Pedobacter mucosus]|uniref:Crp/Fnr family transcriptional regulator n=1 Tax=Pedobacter mucosus TaxID=2895286 RepID=UPI001EE4CDC4|nr:Crp/Fnr family transcriptional regulator [Pedobacter mucosus]UKT65994.1 Crp/Fnr family transcriptional regulator [Pedobacter mucosus]